MYRKSDEYERMVDLAISIIEDYDICEYPLNMFELVRKMGFELIPYSLYYTKSDLLIKKSKDGFNIPRCTRWGNLILYNDDPIYATKERISQTLGHEIKHICEGDTNDDEDDLCDYFSKYLRCPIPYVLYLGLDSELEIMSRFNISYEQSKYVLSSVRNRRLKYGTKYFRKELIILQKIVGKNLRENTLEFIN